MGILVIINIFFMLFFFVVAYMSLRYFINQIEKYPKVTLEEIYNSKKTRQKYNIENEVNPLDYGYDFKEVSFKSGKINLCGWFIDNKNSNKVVILCHGRGGNRLTTLQYLKIFQKNNMNQYGIFLVDLRNSGRSDTAKTKLGYDFAQDIFNAMCLLKSEYNKDTFVLYGFSQGAMGASIVSRMYINQLRKKEIKIEKLILDSPLSNVRKRIKEDANKRRIPKFIVSVVIRIFNIRVGNNLEKLRLSYLIRRVPTLILQSKSDKVTTYGMLIEEYNLIAQNKLLKLKIFENAPHTRIYGEKEYREEYEREVVNFLNEK